MLRPRGKPVPRTDLWENLDSRVGSSRGWPIAEMHLCYGTSDLQVNGSTMVKPDRRSCTNRSVLLLVVSGGNGSNPPDGPFIKVRLLV